MKTYDVSMASPLQIEDDGDDDDLSSSRQELGGDNSYDEENDGTELGEEEELESAEEMSNSDLEEDGNGSHDEPLVRDHSYLPTSHPLHTDNHDLQKSGCHSFPVFSRCFPTSNSGVFELAILELPDVVLFPGQSLPIRLSDGAWREYLGRQIHDSRCGRDALSSSSTPLRKEPVCFGILTALQSRDGGGGGGGRRRSSSSVSERRQSWTRQGLGPVQLRRLSDRLVEELGVEYDALLESEEEETEEEEEEGQHQAQPEPDPQQTQTNRSRIRRRSVRNSGQQQQLELDRRRRRGTSTRSINSNSGSNRSNDVNQNEARHRFLGRIGTIATITFTHGDEGSSFYDDNSPGNNPLRVWRESWNHEGGELVVTVQGSSRFRIISFLNSDDEDEFNREEGQHSAWQYHQSSHFRGVRKFRVERIKDLPMSPPPKILPYRVASSAVLREDQVIQNISRLWGVPAFAYRALWPWRLVAQIREVMKRTPTLKGLNQSLEAALDNSKDDDQHQHRASPRRLLLEPLLFSFWMASNLALCSQEEKLRLLEMLSISERLGFLHDKVLTEESALSVIHCRNCGTPLTPATHIFTVGGAEGTTGSYVNEHGCIHQTTTVREIDEREVRYQGEAETYQSWFPGYSWTIMNCGLCATHLGWKFLQTTTAAEYRRRSSHSNASNRDHRHSQENRPPRFYGLTAAKISTHAR